MVFGGCSITFHRRVWMFCICPQPNGFDPSITGHFLESHVLEDDENCLRHPMTSMGGKG